MRLKHLNSICLYSNHIWTIDIANIRKIATAPGVFNISCTKRSIDYKILKSVLHKRWSFTPSSASENSSVSSQSGCKTKARFRISLCGRVSSGVSVSTPSYNIISISIIRGAFLKDRTRPSAASIPRHAPSSALGERPVRIFTQIL